MKRVIKLIPSDQIRHMPDNENPFVRGDIIIRPEDFGPYWGDNPGDGPDGDFGLGSASDPSREGGFTELFDFGASTVELRPEAAAARDVGKLHAGLADAVGRLDTFTRELMDDPDFESYPRRLAEETGRIRNEIGGTIPDGEHGAWFENAFELMSRNAATRIRGAATQRLVIGNRLGLDKSLGTYAALVADSTDPVTTDFAANRGLEAIDDQVAAGIIDEAEAARLGQGFMVDIDEKSAASLIKDDPAFAVTEFDTAGAFPNLTDSRRTELASHAKDRMEAVKRDTELAKARSERTEALDIARAADAFEAGYLARLDTGRATLAEISDAGLQGTVTPARATRLKTAFEQAATRRIENDRLARVLADARETGAPLDTDNADHKAALESDFERNLKPALIAARTPEDIATIRRLVLRDGIVPDGLGPMIDVMWRSGDPALAAKAARLLIFRPGDATAVVTNFPLRPRPGMEDAVQLMDSGIPPEQAIPMAEEMAKADVGGGEGEDTRAGAAGEDDLSSADATPETATADDTEPGGDEILPDDEEFEFADPDEVFDDPDDGPLDEETAARLQALIDRLEARVQPDPLTSGSFRDAADRILNSFNENRERSGPPDPLVAEIGQLVLELAPGTGEVLSAREAGVAFAAMLDAAKKGEIGPALGKGGEGTLAALGAIPGLGAIVRVPKSAVKLARIANRVAKRRKGARGSTDAGGAAVAKRTAVKLPKLSRVADPEKLLRADEFVKLPEAGMIDPNLIRTVQNSVKRRFKTEAGRSKGRTIEEMVETLRAGRAHDIPPVRIMEYDGKVWTLDHRRLVAARVAGTELRYKKVRFEDVKDEFADKFGTSNDGLSIAIRGILKEK